MVEKYNGDKPMTKDQAKIIRLLAKIQNECGKINFNTEHGNAVFFYNHYHVSISLNDSVLISSTYKKEVGLVSELESALTELKEYYRMNRIIVKKGES